MDDTKHAPNVKVTFLSRHADSGGFLNPVHTCMWLQSAQSAAPEHGRTRNQYVQTGITVRERHTMYTSLDSFLVALGLTNATFVNEGFRRSANSLVPEPACKKQK